MLLTILVNCLLAFTLGGFFAAGLMFIRRGLWRGLRDQHPYCDACGYNLFTRYSETDQCPECGVEITDSSAVRFQARRFHTPSLAIGALSLLLSLTPIVSFFLWDVLAPQAKATAAATIAATVPGTNSTQLSAPVYQQSLGQGYSDNRSGVRGTRITGYTAVTRNNGSVGAGATRGIAKVASLFPEESRTDDTATASPAAFEEIVPDLSTLPALPAGYEDLVANLSDTNRAQFVSTNDSPAQKRLLLLDGFQAHQYATSGFTASSSPSFASANKDSTPFSTWLSRESFAQGATRWHSVDYRMSDPGIFNAPTDVRATANHNAGSYRIEPVLQR